MRIKLFLTALAVTVSMAATAQLAPGSAAPDFTTQGALAGKAFTLNLQKQLKKGKTLGHRPINGIPKSATI